MKIAMAHLDLPNESRGGAASQAHLLANQLVARGHEVTFFTFSPAYEQCRYQVHTYPRKPKARYLRPLFFAWNLARTDFSGFDVVHTHGDNFLLWKAHPQVRTFHGSALDEAKSATQLRRKLHMYLIALQEMIGARVADLCVGVSKNTQRRIPKISRIIPCGVDTAGFSPGVKSARPSILFVGAMTGRKRGELLLDLFENTIRNEIPEAELWLVCDRKVAGPGLRSFNCIPSIELQKLYREAWVFCLPSTYEGFGVPYIEAMASGTPVIATHNPGANEVIDSKYGIIAPDTGLAAAIIDLIKDENLRRQLATRGQARASEYSWDIVCPEYEKLYLEVQKL